MLITREIFIGFKNPKHVNSHKSILLKNVWFKSYKFSLKIIVLIKKEGE